MIHDPFAVKPDGTTWEDVKPQGDLPASRGQKKLIEPGSTGKKVKKSDLEGFTRRALIEAGYSYGKTEHYNTYSGTKRDLFNFVDAIAVKEGKPIMFVQTCSRAHLAAHIRKSVTGRFKIGSAEYPALPALRAILASGGAQFVIFAWDQPGGAGTRWRCDRVVIGYGHIEQCLARQRRGGES